VYYTVIYGGGRRPAALMKQTKSDSEDITYQMIIRRWRWMPLKFDHVHLHTSYFLSTLGAQNSYKSTTYKYFTIEKGVSI